MSIRDYKLLRTVFSPNFYQNESSNTGDCVEPVQPGVPFEGMGVAFEDCGREKGRVFSKPRSWDLGAHSQGVQGKGRARIGTGSPG